MSLSRQDIIDLALRYISRDEVIDFPVPGDIFCLFQRELPANSILKDDEGWKFAGYNLCREYTIDDETKPAGKWLWMRFVSLSVYPPVESVLKLQPPHVVKGMFQNPERTHELRILKINLDKILSLKDLVTEPGNQSEVPQTGQPNPSNILQFPIHKVRKKKSGSGNNGDDGAA